MAIEVFSFFSGLGFMDLGFEEAGFDIAFVNEYNHSFIQAYQYARRNRPHRPQYGYYEGSIEEFLDDRVWNQRFPDYDVRNKDRIIGFIGGPPCPDFSTAGKNAGSTGENGKLTEKYVKLIVKRQPDFFVLENVKGLYQTKKHKIFYEQMKKRLYRAGYSLFDSIENALEYGVPQFRDRLILVGFNRRRFGKSMYVPLFSAVVAKYQGGREDAPRLISLDEAFAGVDNRNIRDMFRLMTQFGFDFIINSQVLWGDCDTLDALAIYQLIRPENAKFVTVMPYLWNGHGKELLDDEESVEQRGIELETSES